MQTNKSYVLTVPLDVFMQKTSKVEFGKFISESGGVIRPTRVQIGEFEDIAYFELGTLEYELPSLYWKYFAESEPLVGGDISVTLPEEEPKLANRTEHIYGNSLNITGNVRINNAQNHSGGTEPATLTIQPDYILYRVESVQSDFQPEPNARQLFQFHHDFLNNDNTGYCNPVGMDADFESLLAITTDLYKLKQRSDALDKLKSMIETESKAVQSLIDAHYAS